MSDELHQGEHDDVEAHGLQGTPGLQGVPGLQGTPANTERDDDVEGHMLQT